jgi:hypothetical protein
MAGAVAGFVDDPHRFRNAEAVSGYLGLVPNQDRNRVGHVTRVGPPFVRPLLAETA